MKNGSVEQTKNKNNYQNARLTHYVHIPVRTLNNISAARYEGQQVCCTFLWPIERTARKTVNGKKELQSYAIFACLQCCCFLLHLVRSLFQKIWAVIAAMSRLSMSLQVSEKFCSICEHCCDASASAAFLRSWKWFQHLEEAFQSHTLEIKTWVLAAWTE